VLVEMAESMIAALTQNTAPAEVLAFSLRDAARVGGISESRLRRDIADGRLRAKRIGVRQRIILRQDLEEYLRGLPA
jgi:excisionase family DNA binding protein